ncbi:MULTISPECIES: hypothetical protein [unclassified Fibrobacter]|uniref:hypothetical protein n=1 Tax=unclassified Fibrobacter TaxID=2634177 RepID=UPI00091BC0C5|nr:MULTISPECIES: hypothetical protein [unclassified Fibrobacter]OWV07273.1 hypothetical protein B7993_03430 [Fibrobacter sp. UWH3]SHK81893.1 hypothetical protein SAMN05720765_105131 [Fibrobacter sp. UWH6]
MRKLFLLSLFCAATVFAQQDDSDALDFADENSASVSAPAPSTYAEPASASSPSKCSVYSPCANTAESNTASGQPVAQVQTAPARSAFFLDLTLGIMWNSYSRETVYRSYASYYDDYYNRDQMEREYSGLGPILGLKIGGNIRGWAAPHFVMEFGRSYGETEEEYYDSDENEYRKAKTSAFRFFIGGGVTCFLSNDPQSASSGVFLGLDFGFVLSAAQKHISWDDVEDVGGIDDVAVGIKFETGYVWRMADHFNIGFTWSLSIDDAVDDNDSDYRREESSMYTVGFALTIMRK